MHHLYSFIVTYYDGAKDYFEIDPLLLKLFAYLVPKTEFTALCERIPPYLSMEVLVNRALFPIHPNVSHINKRGAVSESNRSFQEEIWIRDIEQVKLACVHHTTHQYSE
jgi:hypothetical protein